VEETTRFVNDCVRSEEQKQELVDLQKEFAPKIDLVSGWAKGRRLLKRGTVAKMAKIDSVQ
jgi:hypothetical protein